MSETIEGATSAMLRTTRESYLIAKQALEAALGNPASTTQTEGSSNRTVTFGSAGLVPPNSAGVVTPAIEVAASALVSSTKMSGKVSMTKVNANI